MSDILVQVATKMNGRAGPQFEKVQITPELAREWLRTTNKRNRKIKWDRVHQHVGAIRRGEWRLNGDAIRFDKGGVLIDGQNRLQAVVEADTPITSFVVWGLEPDAQNTIDVGSRRSLADALTIAGESNTTILASTIRLAFIYDRFLETDIDMDRRTQAPTIQQCLGFFEAHRGRLIAAVLEGGTIRKKLSFPAAAAATAWFVCHELDWEECEDFFHKLKLGASLEEKNPIFVLRRWLENNAAKTHDKPTSVFVLAIILKAWNAYRDGRKVELLSYKPGGKAPERFPVAR